MEDKPRKKPTLLISLLPVVILIIMLGYSLFVLGLDLDTGGSHIPLILGAAIATVVEALPLKIAGHKLDDNLTIPLIAGAAMTLLRMVLS